MIKCPKCEGNHNGSCPTCHAHGYLVAPIEFWLASSVVHALMNRLRGSGETSVTTEVLTVDYWLGWAFNRAVPDASNGYGHALRLAEKRAELAGMAIEPLLELAGSALDEENPPRECTALYWFERATEMARRRTGSRPEITTIVLGPVTDSANLMMAL